MECPSSACSSGLEHSCHNDTEHVILRIKEGTEKVSPASHNVLTQNPWDLKQAAWAWFLSRAVFCLIFVGSKFPSIKGTERVPGPVPNSPRLTCRLSTHMDTILNSMRH